MGVSERSNMNGEDGGDHTLLEPEIDESALKHEGGGDTVSSKGTVITSSS